VLEKSSTGSQLINDKKVCNTYEFGRSNEKSEAKSVKVIASEILDKNARTVLG
jgi:hypothetical protein